MSDLYKELAEAALEHLFGRSGIGAALEQCDEDIMTEIYEESAQAMRYAHYEHIERELTRE